LSTTITDPDGGKKTEGKDCLGRVKRVIEYSESGELYTDYQYNAAGDLLTVTDAMGNVTSMSYDSLGRKIGMIDPDMGSWHYIYDANGNLITQTDANGDTITFSYDKLNRVTGKTYSTPPAIDLPVQLSRGISGKLRLSSGKRSAAYRDGNYGFYRICRAYRL